MKIEWKKWMKGGEEGKKDLFSAIFPFLLLGAVIILVMTNTNRNIPDTAGNDVSRRQEVRQTDADAYARMLEEKLTDAFSKMNGVGRVQVYVTLAGSGEDTVLKDEGKKAENIREEASGTIRTSDQTEIEETTVTDGTGSPYVLSSRYPKIQGVLIVAQGASSAVVRGELLAAASTLLGLSYQQIQVATYQS